MRMYRKIGVSLTMVALVGSAAAARAAERVTLRNGSALVCDHQKNLDGQVRLYLTSSEENYLEVAAAEIVAVETVRPEAILPMTAPKETGPSQTQTTPPADIPALLHQAGVEHHLDPDLLASVVHAESDGRT